MTTVTVYHNIATDPQGRMLGWAPDGYTHGHPLVPVARFDVATPTGVLESVHLLESVYDMFNIGHDPDFGTPHHLAVEYRAAENRSLSVGDVISLAADGETTWHAVDHMGWITLDRGPDWFAMDASRHGTTPLPAEVMAS